MDLKHDAIPGNDNTASVEIPPPGESDPKEQDFYDLDMKVMIRDPHVKFNTNYGCYKRASDNSCKKNPNTF